MAGFALGVVVNPTAGLGGLVGLKGSDGDAVKAIARTLGGRAQAVGRVGQALAALRGQSCAILTVAGEMGEASCRLAGLTARVVHAPSRADTGAGDTRAAVSALLAAGAQLIVFGGGDGTARDVSDAVRAAGRDTPLIGLPCGVKMYSGVFATSARRGGELAAACAGGRFAVHRVELLDIDEASLRRDVPATRLYGEAWAPVDRLRMQAAKASAPSSADLDVEAACRRYVAEMTRGRLYLRGPGTTMARLSALAGVDGSRLGVDAIANGELVGRDLSERAVLALLERWPDAAIVVGVIGRQGCLFGRGNQPLSARVLARVSRKRIDVIAGVGKLIGLERGRLFVDTGDASLDRRLEGIWQVRTGARDRMAIRVGEQGADAGAGQSTD
ncbi:ATP-NAD kinase family protein [Burkholderia gladioli]|uniref:ATP-NAD kinase family protein n=1 Tax=Burkholderia gladioli TaxID=28095 RepID=UPI00163F3530|nr:NAD(+)/NADH kinase [Burkholderia gladioli]